MEFTQLSNKRPRAINSANSNELDLSSTETQLMLSALHSIQEALAIVSNNKIIHSNTAFLELLNINGHQQFDLTTLKTAQHGISENLVDHIQRAKSSGMKSNDLTILMDGHSKGVCSIHPLSTEKTLLLIRPDMKKVDWYECKPS